jgi:hypothetical protein
VGGLRLERTAVGLSTESIDWRVLHVGFEGDEVEIRGLGIWRHDWRRAGVEPVELRHPAYPNQIHRYDVYEIGGAASPVRFAAGELSNGVWGFYVPV